MMSESRLRGYMSAPVVINKQQHNVDTEVIDNYKFLSQQSLHELFGDFKESELKIIFEKSGLLFLNELDERLNNLEKSIREKNYNNTKYETHRLKGDFNAMGAPYLMEICRTIEKNLLHTTDPSIQDRLVEKYDLLKSCSHLYRKEFTYFLKQLRNGKKKEIV